MAFARSNDAPKATHALQVQGRTCFSHWSARSLTYARRLVQNSVAWSAHTFPGFAGMLMVAGCSQYAQHSIITVPDTIHG